MVMFLFTFFYDLHGDVHASIYRAWLRMISLIRSIPKQSLSSQNNWVGITRHSTRSRETINGMMNLNVQIARPAKTGHAHYQLNAY